MTQSILLIGLVFQKVPSEPWEWEILDGDDRVIVSGGRYGSENEARENMEAKLTELSCRKF